MIVFDLACTAGGHVFEAWFGSSEDYEQQRQRRLVQCPLCGCGEVSKAPMAPAVARSAAPAEAGPGKPPAEVRELLASLAKAQAKALAGSTWVGDRFAAEARAMHLGEREEKPVHGRASVAEARSLLAEGIPVAPLPLPVVPPDEAN